MSNQVPKRGLERAAEDAVLAQLPTRWSPWGAKNHGWTAARIPIQGRTGLQPLTKGARREVKSGLHPFHCWEASRKFQNISADFGHPIDELEGYNKKMHLICLRLKISFIKLNGWPARQVRSTFSCPAFPHILSCWMFSGCTNWIYRFCYYHTKPEAHDRCNANARTLWSWCWPTDPIQNSLVIQS